MGGQPADDTTGGVGGVTTLFECLAHGDRRRLLGIVHEHAPDPLTDRDLALLVTRSESPSTQDRTVEQTLVSMHHVHLPKLEAAGLVDHVPEEGIVTTTDHPAFRDPAIVDLLTEDVDVGSSVVDALFESLVNARRRAILDVLSHQFQPIHTETLARELGARERGCCEAAVPSEAVEEILTTLLHRHLPKLADAGLIERDEAKGTVAYEGHPRLRVAWMHSVLDQEFRTSLTNGSPDDELGKIEGRENVISYGQSLGERAEDELFCLLTQNDMLEAGSIARFVDASLRGVDVYIGTPDPTVREYIRENAPAATLWTPDADWLDVPVEENRVGRLVVADREAVMLGTLETPTDGDVATEKAIIGEGAENTLVVMIHQLVNARLDTLAEQPTGFERTLPL